MNGKTMGMLAMAVVCGLGAMYGTSRLISRDKNGPAIEMQDVLVAARDIKVEELLKPDLVKVVRMPKTAIPAGGFSTPKDIADRWVQSAILEGEPIIERKLGSKGSPPGLVSRIPPGMRAFSVDVNEQTGVSGFVLPDHRVDVIQIEPGANNGAPEAETLLQDVLVLASGVVFTRPEDRSLQSRTVTLAVTPEQVDILVAARPRGALTLALRGLNDHSHALTAKEKLKAAPPPVKEKAPEPVPPPPPVVVQAPEPIPPPEPVAAPEPLPLPPPPPAPKPARYVTVYKGIDNMRRIRIDQPPDLANNDLATTDTTLASTPSDSASVPKN